MAVLGEQSQGWRDTGGERGREVGGAVGTKLRRLRGIYLYSSFIRDGVGESERRGSETQQGAVANRPAAEVQGSETQQKSYHHSLAALPERRRDAK